MMIGVIKRLTAILLVVSAAELAADTGVVWSAGPYAYDGAGNIKSIGTSETFVYDRLGRLISGTAGSGHLQEYTYDAFGNILSITTDSNTTSPLKPCVDAATNQIDRAGTDCNASGTYDSVGNITAYGTSATFVYDDLDMVEESTVNLARKAYLYNANDERIAAIAIVGGQRSGSEWTIRDNEGRTLRRFQKTATGTWSWTEDYIYRDSALLAAEVPGPERTRHFHLDHLGTPRLITGSGGAEISRHTYYPFGQEATSSGQDTERAKFTGHERDDANLDYMHARYYLPYTGRFLSVDPVIDVKKALVEPQRWNRYAYVTNNPLRYTDPDGKERQMPFCVQHPAQCSADELNGRAPAGNQVFVAAAVFGAPVAVGAVAEAGLFALAKEGLAAAGTWAVGNWDKIQRFAEGVVDFFSPGPSSGRLTSFERASNQLANQLRFTETTAAHMKEAGRMVPRSILAQAILTGARSADPQSAPGAVQITQNIVKNGKDYVLQIIYREKDNVILHFQYAAAK